MKFLLLTTGLLTLFSCTTTHKELQTVDKVDLQRYAGKWYEIARLPNSFEKGLTCVTANYSLKDNGNIKVVNRGHKKADKQVVKQSTGSARVPNKDYPAKLKVSFFWPFSGDYWILALDDNYQYAMVGAPSRKYLWILSRTKQLDKSIVNKLLNQAEQAGFDTGDIMMIGQDCE